MKMNKLSLTTTLAAATLAVATLGLAACGETSVAENDMAGNDNGVVDTSADSATTTGDSGSSNGAWAGARIVEENGAFYRVNADGTRVALGPNDSRILVENDVRYRVDPDGTRVRIGDDGLEIDVDGPDVDLPDVDVGVNEKGNLDVDVGDRDPDGGR
jgi:hypothetical protein